jgi:putative nucleotidyltransferase with HDIG domain
MRLIEKETVNADEIAKVVATDPAVAARVLKIANSAFYGCQRQIQTISGAIVVLGFNTLRSMVVAASVKDVYGAYGLTEKMLWEHSVAAGIAARMIAQDTRKANAEEAFLAGLLHDIGKIIMNSFDRDKSREVVQRCYNENLFFQDVERSVFPFSHAEVGALVVKKWNFPEGLTHAILHHHDLASDSDDDQYLKQLTAVVSLADLFCHKLGLGTRAPREDLDLPASGAAGILRLDDIEVGRQLAKFQRTYEKDKARLA